MLAPPPAAESPRRAAERRLADRRTRPARASDGPLVWAALATAAGAMLAAAGPRPEWFALASACALASWLVCWKQDRQVGSVAALLMSLALLGASWAGANHSLFDARDIGRYAPIEAEPVCLEVTVTAEPTLYPAGPATPFRAIPLTERTVLEATVDRLRDRGSWRDVAGRCEVTIAGHATQVRAGDRLRVFGQLRRPRPALNPGERDLAALDRAERRFAIVWCEAEECVDRLDAEPIGLPSDWLGSTRRVAGDSIDRLVAPSAAPLAKAMLLGDSSDLPQETFEAFRRTGTVHLLVVSGLHVGLVASVFPALAAAGLFPRRLAWITALVLAGGYVLIVGARPPAVRAGIVVAAAGVAALSGRRPISLNSLAGAALAVFVASPGAWTLTGTRLSFTAAATLVGVATVASRRRARYTPPLERLIRSARSPAERFARGVVGWVVWCLAASAAVQTVTGPLVASEFHLISPAAGPLSLLLAPLLWLVIVGGSISVALAPLEGAAAAAGFVASGAAGWMLEVVASTAESPLAGFWTAGPAPWWVGLWTAWVGGGAALLACWPARRGLAARAGLAVLASAFVPELWRAATAGDELRCTFLAVGHGSSTLIETPTGGAILVDAGALAAPERVADTIARALWARGVRRIDALVLTHADTDHFNAVPGLLERFPVDVVLTTTLMLPTWDDPSDHKGPAELRRLLDNLGVPIRSVELGDRWRVGSTDFLVLHPDDIGVVGSDNANSLVLGIEHDGRRVLLPGDLEEDGLEAVMAQEPYDCDLLLAPHHGSQRSDPHGFAQWCRPEAVIVSSGGSRHTSEEAFDSLGAQVWNTHDAGAVTATLSETGVVVRASR